jgi:2-hydroxycyclohexanecarboxyl-CoA dehydrogenase
MSLKGKVAIVTGAGRGIGKAIALVLADKGADIAIVEILKDNALEVAQEIKNRGRKTEVYAMDVTNLELVKEMAEGVIEKFGKVDILVNNVGWDLPKPFIETTPDLWNKVLDINLRSTLNCTHVILNHMMANKGGRIVNIASDAGLMGGIYAAVYSAAKGGIIAFTKTIAREMASYNILANCIAPGPIETPLVNEISREEKGASMMRKTLRMIPLKRLGRPEEIAHAVAFFASDEASYITGQVLSVDGGMLMA